MLRAVTCARIAAALLLATLALPSRVWAQSEGHFAIGGVLTARMASDPNVQDNLSPGLLWRFGHGNEGWGPHWGLNWFSADVKASIGGSETELGELHIRPFMGGYGYTYTIGRSAITADALVGYAFGSIRMSPLATDAYHDRLGARSITAKSSNTFTLKPEVDVWYDVSEKVGINVNAGYIVARPHVTVRSTLGKERRAVRADHFVLSVGMVYSVF
jgi:hypothetical protein